MPLSLTKLAILKTEIDTDPLARIYSGMTDDQLITSLNNKNRDFWITLSSAQIYQAVDLTELLALSAADQVRMDRVFSLAGEIVTAPGTNVRTEMIAVFGGASTTISNLASLANRPISRGAELTIGQVHQSNLGRMRTEAGKGII